MHSSNSAKEICKIKSKRKKEKYGLSFGNEELVETLPLLELSDGLSPRVQLPHELAWVPVTDRYSQVGMIASGVDSRISNYKIFLIKESPKYCFRFFNARFKPTKFKNFSH